MDKQRCLQATSTPANTTSMNVATGVVVQDDALNIKEEWADADLDIGPTVLQPMDATYRPIQPDVSIIKQESRIKDNDMNAILCGGVKEEIIEDERRADTDVQRSNEALQSVLRARSPLHSCEECMITYTRIRSLLAHYRNVHPTEAQKCTKCNKKFPKAYLSQHTTDAHSEQQHECAVCKKTYRSKPALYQHVYKVHRARPAVTSPVIYTCDYCLKTYTTKLGLVQHIDVVHTNVRYRCSECNKEYKGKLYLQAHIKRVHSKEKHEFSSPVVYPCDYCHKTYKSKRSLIYHIDVVHTKVRYRCSECKKEYTGKLFLQRHIRRVHSKEKHEGSGPRIHICDYCQKTFTIKGNLGVHITRVHASGSYKCSQCNRHFKCEQYLMRHMSHNHTAGLQIHTCEYCQKTYRYKAALWLHRKNIHVAAHIHRCRRCNENFKSNNELQRHNTSIHALYKCQVCLKFFKTICTLRRHFKKAHNSKDIQFQSDVHPHAMPDLRLTADVTNAAASTSKQQHNVDVVKEEPADAELELGPVVFQHMDCNYRPYKQEPQDGAGD